MQCLTTAELTHFWPVTTASGNECAQSWLWSSGLPGAEKATARSCGASRSEDWGGGGGNYLPVRHDQQLIKLLSIRLEVLYTNSSITQVARKKD